MMPVSPCRAAFLLMVALVQPSALVGQYWQPLEADMALHPLNLLQGREAKVPCRINRNIGDLSTSTVEFIQEPRDNPLGDEGDYTTLTRNGQLVEGDPDFYDIEVITGEDFTTYRLVFKNPRPRDEGYLYCIFRPDRAISPRVISYRSSRFVLVFGPRNV